MTFPAILRQDVTGEVFAVGPGVDRFQIGDCVCGFAVGHATKCEEDKGFQSYTILQTNMAGEIPDTIPLENAVMIGLGLSTTADPLFNPDFLNHQLPTEPAQKLTGKTLLVWGRA